MTLRTALILTVGVLVAAGVAVATVTAGLGLMETLATTGSAFAGTVAFLHSIIA